MDKNNNKKILIVDDDSSLRETLKEILEGKGFCRIFTAKNGEEGVTLARQEAPDLILMNMMMPVLSGRQAAAALAEDKRTKDIPLIFLTGIFGGQRAYLDGQQILEVNGREYPLIKKPYSAEEVFEKIEDYLK